MLTRAWSKYQKAVFEAVSETNDSLLIEAVAGSGKTTTIIEAINHVPKDKSILLLAFNKGIQLELERRITASNARCLTLHSCGFSAWKRFTGGDVQVDSGKVLQIQKELLSWPERQRNGKLGKLLGLAKGAGIVPGAEGPLEAVTPLARIPQGRLSLADLPSDSGNASLTYKGLLDDDLDNWRGLMEEYDIGTDEVDIAAAKRILKASIDRAFQTVDFDDMCQPPGTMVTLANGKGQKPIEEIQEGDQVVSYIRNESRFGRSRAVKKIGCRTHVGEIIAVAAGGKSTHCTPNHKWLIRFNKTAESKWCVYLMNRGRRWRIGSCRLRYGKRGCGPRQRMFTEGADNLWILKVCDTQAQAFARESILAAKYGLPMMVFKAGNNRMEGYQEVIETVFNAVPGQESKAMEVLGDFCLQPDLPHISKKGSNSTSFRLSGRNSFICAACNLLPDVMSVALHPENTWEPIKISRSYYSGPVYSMEVEKELYVADGILTHNCYMPVIASVPFPAYDVVFVDEAQDLSGIQRAMIQRMLGPDSRIIAVGDSRQAIYHFRGASSDSMPLIQQDFRCKSLPLSISYRCPRKVVEHAQQWVEHIEWAEGAEDGEVRHLEGFDLKGFRASDAILCRLTRPLVSTAFRLIRNKIPCRILGRDIGSSLVALVKKSKIAPECPIRQFSDWLEDYLSRESKKLSEAEETRLLGVLNDKVETLRVFLSSASTVGGLIQEIEQLFQDNGSGVTLSTIHKAKGMEWERVFILDAPELMPCKWASNLQEELNLSYVAATRAMHELVYVASAGLK